MQNECSEFFFVCLIIVHLMPIFIRYFAVQSKLPALPISRLTGASSEYVYR